MNFKKIFKFIKFGFSIYVANYTHAIVVNMLIIMNARTFCRRVRSSGAYGTGSRVCCNTTFNSSTKYS